MRKSNVAEIKEEEKTGSIVQQFIYRLPKKNHHVMAQLEKHFIDIFKKQGRLRFEVFQLSSNEKMMKDWTNIGKVVSAEQDEEVWVEQIFKIASTGMSTCQSMENNENMDRLYKQFMDLITPGFIPIMGEFRHLRV